MNIRASYPDEVFAFINYATGSREFTKISLFYQDDAFGQPGVEALLKVDEPAFAQ